MENTEFYDLINSLPVKDANVSSLQNLLYEAKKIDASEKTKKEKRKDIKVLLNHPLLIEETNIDFKTEGVYYEIYFYVHKINDEKQHAYNAIEQRFDMFIESTEPKNRALDIFCEYLLFALSERRYIQESYLKYFMNHCVSHQEEDILKVLKGFNLLSIGYTIQDDEWILLKEMSFKNAKWKTLVDYIGLVNMHTRNNHLKSIEEGTTLRNDLSEESDGRLITNIYLLEIVNYMSLKETFVVFKLIKNLENRLTLNNEYTRALRREIEQLKSHTKNPSYSPSFARMLGESFYPKTIINRRTS